MEVPSLLILFLFVTAWTHISSLRLRPLTQVPSCMDTIYGFDDSLDEIFHGALWQEPSRLVSTLFIFVDHQMRLCGRWE